MDDAIVTSLKSNGFTKISEILEASIAQELGECLDSIPLNTVNYDQYGQTKVIHNPFLYSNEARNLIFNPILLKLVNRFISNHLSPVLNMQAAVGLTDSTTADPLGRSFQIPHSDFYTTTMDYDNPLELCFVIALDPITEESGSTIFYEKSHYSGRKPTDLNDESEFRMCSYDLEPGDAVAFFGTTWHKAGIGDGTSRRWMISQRYTPWFIKQAFDFFGSISTLDSFNDFASLDVLMQLFGKYSVPPRLDEERSYTVTHSVDLVEYS